MGAKLNGFGLAVLICGRKAVRVSNNRASAAHSVSAGYEGLALQSKLLLLLPHDSDTLRPADGESEPASKRAPSESE